MDPNWFAIAALLLWPVFSLILYRVQPVSRATVVTVLGGVLLLPVGTSLKLEGIPALDKHSAASLAVLIGCGLSMRRIPKLFARISLPDALIAMMLIGPFISAATNTDPLTFGPLLIAGSSYYDALSSVVGQYLFILPFLIGRQLLRSSEDVEEVLRTLAIAGLCYSPLMLLEIRLSPQLHTWIYGYFPHSFGQQVRQGGYRPIVFLGHGLLVAFFIMTTTVASAALWRTGTRIVQLPGVAVTAYSTTLLVLCKSMGALLYGVVLVPLVRLAGPRMQLRIAFVLVVIACLYPLLRATDLFPSQLLVDWAASIDNDRALSLKYRFDNEDRLLERAWARVSFGWSRFGRNRIYDEDSGQDMSVTDGRWIIVMGQFGMVGFLAEFGLLAVAVFKAMSALRYVPQFEQQILLAALALIVAISLVDLLPNASLNPWTWLMAGVLLGRAEALKEKTRMERPLVDWRHPAIRVP